MDAIDLEYAELYEKLLMSEARTLTVAQAASICSLTERTVRRMCKRGDIKAAKAGKTWRIARDPLLKQLGLID